MWNTMKATKVKQTAPTIAATTETATTLLATSVWAAPARSKTDITAKFPTNRLFCVPKQPFFRHDSLENVLPLRVPTSGCETSGLQMRDHQRGQFSPRSRRTLMGIELTVAMSLTVVPWLSLSLRRRRLLLLVPVLQFCRRTSIKTHPPSPDQ